MVKKSEQDEISVVQKIITEKSKLIKEAKRFLELMDSDFDNIDDETWMWMDKHRIDQRTITYLYNLILGDENAFNDFITSQQ